MKLKHIQWSKFLAIGVLGAVFAVAYGTNPSVLIPPKAEALNNVDVTGYAWANTPQSAGDPETGTDQGLGWISMKDTSGSDLYGVKVDLDTGNFSGYGWIGNGGSDGAGSTGWIDFAPTSGFPSVPNHGVRKESNGTLTGWARVVSMYNEDPSMGWIKFSKDASDVGADYGVTVDANGSFLGYAWGSDVIGWVKFDIPSNPNPVVCSGCISCTGWSSWEDTTDCGVVPSGTSIEQTRFRTCGSTPETETQPSGKTCGASCGSDADCGDGEVCLLGTGKCGNPTTGCGNGTCNVGETLLSCPQDCKGSVQQF